PVGSTRRCTYATDHNWKPPPATTAQPPHPHVSPPPQIRIRVRGCDRGGGGAGGRPPVAGADPGRHQRGAACGGGTVCPLHPLERLAQAALKATQQPLVGLLLLLVVVVVVVVGLCLVRGAGGGCLHARAGPGVAKVLLAGPPGTWPR